MARQLADFVRSGSASPIITEELARQWLDDVRERIYARASRMNAKPRPYTWKAEGAAILAKIKRARAALDKARAA